MTHRASGQGTSEQGVVIAIGGERDERQSVARGFAFFPQLVAAPTPEDESLSLQSERERIAIHPRDHQYLTAVRVLNDGRDEPSGIKLQGVDVVLLQGHNRTSISASCRAFFKSGIAISPL
jgi:hypothetical protein